MPSDVAEGLATAKPPTQRSPRSPSNASGPEQSERDHSDSVGSAVCLRSRGDHRRIDEVAAETLAQPVEVPDVSIFETGRKLDLEGDDPFVAIENEVDFVITPCSPCPLPVIYLVSLPILGDQWGADAVVAFALWVAVLITAVCYFIAGISRPKSVASQPITRSPGRPNGPLS